MTDSATIGHAGVKAREQFRLLRLGQVVRARRKGLMTVEQLAAKANVSSGLISQIERGKGNPSFKTMQRLASALEMPISALLQEDGAPPADGPPTGIPQLPVTLDVERASVVRRDARKKLIFAKESIYWELLTPDLNRSLEMLRAVVPPDYDTTETPFLHSGEECVHVVRGTLQVQLGDQSVQLSSGDTITYDASVPHCWRNVGGTEAEVISACTPPSF